MTELKEDDSKKIELQKAKDAVREFEGTGALKDACAMQARVLELDMDDKKERFALAMLLVRTNDLAGAEDHFRWFKENAPDYPDFLGWQQKRNLIQAYKFRTQAEQREFWAYLIPFLDIDILKSTNYLFQGDSAGGVRSVVGKEVDRFIVDNHVKLRGGEFEFISKTDLVIIMYEIFINEDYFFESEKKKPYIIDCGANIGLSVFYHKTRFPDCEVLAFEPGRRAFGVLQRNVEAMNWGDVTVLPYALGGAAGMQTFFDPKDMPMGGSLTSRMSDKGYEGDTYTVETRLLSDFIDREVDFLKLDIEGVEDAVLHDIGDKLRFVKNIFCEIHYSSSGEKLNTRLLSILSLLDQHGFDAFVSPSALTRGMIRRNLERAGDRSSLNLWAVNRKFASKV